MSKSILSNGISTIDTEQETKSRSSHCSLTLVWRVIIVTVGAIYLTMNLYEMYVTKQEIRHLKSLVRESHVARQQDLFEWSQLQTRKKRQTNSQLRRNTANGNANHGSTHRDYLQNGNGNIGNGYTNRNNGNGNGNGNNNNGGFQSGSTFVRWGRRSCPQGTGVIYSGYAAGANPLAGYGGSSELECLPTNPAYYPNSPSPRGSRTLMAAAKFSLGGQSRSFSIPDRSMIACAVCLTRRSPTVMIPGWTDCPHSWTRVYYGYLMSSPAIPSQYYFSAKNYCVDRQPEFYPGHDDSQGARLTFVQAGSCYRNKSPCKNYRANHKISCTVCSKLNDKEISFG